MAKVLSISTLVLGVLSLGALTCIQPAEAQQSHMDSNKRFVDAQNLPKVNWHKSRMMVNIVDDSPLVTDNREAPGGTKYVITVPPLPQAQSETVFVSPGGMSGVGTGGGGALPPGSVVLDPSRPPRARLGTNIPARGIVADRPLPNGQSTNMLAKQNVSGQLTAPKKFVARTATAPGKLRTSAPASVAAAEYPRAAGVQTSTSSSVRTSVSGKINRGDLLGQTKNR